MFAAPRAAFQFRALWSIADDQKFHVRQRGVNGLRRVHKERDVLFRRETTYSPNHVRPFTPSKFPFWKWKTRVRF